MRRVILATLALTMVVGLASAAQATGWGFGGFGGVSIPIAQDDAAKGVVFGGQLRLSLGGMFGLEPNFTYFRNGDWKTDKIPDSVFVGSKFTSIGVNLILGGAGPVKGFRFFPFVGGKYYNEKNDFRDFTKAKLGWDAGLGVEIGAGSIGIEARAVGELMPLDGGGSRKWVHVRGGLNYYFGIM